MILLNNQTRNTNQSRYVSLRHIHIHPLHVGLIVIVKAFIFFPKSKLCFILVVFISCYLARTIVYTISLNIIKKSLRMCISCFQIKLSFLDFHNFTKVYKPSSKFCLHVMILVLTDVYIYFYASQK